ncbi:amino acid adenylation protein [Corynebacterium sp. 13CS0277]|uniref:Pls/PosA family non-ribosomal peptide synthetase n=1 Tax=Corynebacterium sp. 13CS0277 TaxID=2071994 RepID=UPI000D036D38|nr:Pls/PosA family non-ribosomal peptide synthetase [Corynebacterium sp. 13CS0277]PRQ11549.1 amino acid adenylation protein [Corynebacterium sp. 13CS0277]
MSSPTEFLRAAHAAPPRTLLDVLEATAARFPDAAAIDDGQVITYAELVEEVHRTAAWLASLGIGHGDRVGLRMPSGHKDLYIALLSVLAAGAAYVPVDADDPEERAEIVFGQAQVAAIFGASGLRLTGPRRPARPIQRPSCGDDAWIIFTSGSTGLPKGVAITHRSAAAFVDAEASLFVQDAPLGPEDRVLAGLSVAFDASCEEMWLAWRHGACLVPAPRALVRSGGDLGPWLASRGITVISTVPTLAALWPESALVGVRLMIFGGEACPAELIARLDDGEREVWNTYGPTEATVVACGARLRAGEPVTIGWPLAGWDLAVVDAHGQPAEHGELIIGGVGLGRYLDEDKDRVVYAPHEGLGWARAYRTGDMVRVGPDGLHFIGRVDDQVKIGGRRIELGEVTAQLSQAPHVQAAAVLAQETAAGTKVLVGYFSPTADAFGDGLTPADDPAAAARLVEEVRADLARRMPAALVPRLHLMPQLPVTTSGKVDKKALPWPLETTTQEFSCPRQRLIAAAWADAGVEAQDDNTDFFAAGGTSLAAAAVAAGLRAHAPSLSVRDIYDYPRLGALAERLLALAPDIDAALTAPTGTAGVPGPAGSAADDATKVPVRPVPRATQAAQLAALPVFLGVRALLWLAWLLIGLWGAGVAGPGWALAGALYVLPPVRMLLSAASCRALTAGLQPGEYPRGGVVHLRVWAAERLQEAFGAHGTAGAVFIGVYARLLGCRVGRGVTLHSVPPVTGMARFGAYCAIGPEVDLCGYEVRGDRFLLGPVRIGPQARVGARAVLAPGAHVARGSHLEAHAHLDRRTTPGSRWAGSPAVRVGRPRRTFPTDPPPAARLWVAAHGAAAALAGALPVLSVACGAALVGLLPARLGAVGAARVGWALALAPVGAVVALGVLALLIAVVVRLAQRGLDEDIHPVRSAHGVRIWLVWRLMDDARRHLFPLYAALLTPHWLRLLGARVGRDAEVSTAVLIPRLTEVREETFCADDTQLGGYQLGNGWIRTGRVTIGRRSFVGNSGLVAPGRKVKKNSLIAVLSQAPKQAKANSDWMGSPPVRLRRVAVCADGARTYQPGTALKVARAAVETLRLTAPMTSSLLACGVAAAGAVTWVHTGSVLATWAALLAAQATAGVAALIITVLVKWACVGRIRPGAHALWTPFIWLNELQDAFVESVLAVWLLTKAPGTPLIPAAMRLLGARVGRGCWLESYWLPEADLVRIGDGATVERGCVVQTHLFQDRVMSLDVVRLGAGSSLGPHSVILPGASLGCGTLVGGSSLVLRGDALPAGTQWAGNPVEALTAPHTGAQDANEPTPQKDPESRSAGDAIPLPAAAAPPAAADDEDD